jgi:hypothetical protein
VRWLPVDRFVLVSPFSPGDVAAKLAESVEPKRWFRFFGAGRCPFEGDVGPTTFEIRRIIGYRNSFLPQITGTLSPHASGGTQISVRMALHPFPLVFACLWLGAVFLFNLFFLGTFLMNLAHAKGSDFGLLLGPGMLLFAWALIVGSFSAEARKATTLMMDLWRASKEGPA